MFGKANVDPNVFVSNLLICFGKNASASFGTNGYRDATSSWGQLIVSLGLKNNLKNRRCAYFSMKKNYFGVKDTFDAITGRHNDTSSDSEVISEAENGSFNSTLRKEDGIDSEVKHYAKEKETDGTNLGNDNQSSEMNKDDVSDRVTPIQNSSHPLSVSKALHLLKSVQDKNLSCTPPVNPKPGEIYLFEARDMQKKDDWKCDRIKWLCNGVHHLPRSRPSVIKTYYSTNNGKFRKYAFRPVRAIQPYRILVHYLGDKSGLLNSPHGNRRKQRGRPHMRTCPSTLRTIEEQSKNNKPHTIYRKLIVEPCQNTQIPVTHPRNTEQCRNTVKNFKAKNKIHHDELYAVYEITSALESFTWGFSLAPKVRIVFGLKLLGDELCGLIEEVKDGSLYLSYDTTFNIGDFYMSVLLFKHTAFKDPCPIIPLGFLVHQTKTESEYPSLAAKCLPIVTDREKAIEKAIHTQLPKWTHLHCWNHILSDVKFWVAKHTGTQDDRRVYINNILHILDSTSQHEALRRLQKFELKWSEPFMHYFYDNLNDSVFHKAGRWILESHGVYCSTSGITTNTSESFNAVLKRLLSHGEVRLDEIIIASYFLQNFYYREVLRGRCLLGNYNLIEDIKPLDSDDVNFPSDVIEPDQLVKVIKDGIYSQASTQKHDDCDARHSRSQEGIARWLIAEDRVSLNTSMKCFSVKGLNGHLQAVQLFPHEECSCPARRTCIHISACKLAIGSLTKRKRKLNLIELKRNKRGRTRAGRKKPRTRDDLDVEPAPDSILTKSFSAQDQLHYESVTLMTDDVGVSFDGFQPLLTSTPTKKKPLPSPPEKVVDTPSCQESPSAYTTISEKNTSEVIPQAEAEGCPLWRGQLFPILPKTPKNKKQRAIVSFKGRQWLDDFAIDEFLTICSHHPHIVRNWATVAAFPVHFAEWLRNGMKTDSFLRWAEQHNAMTSDIWLIPTNVNSSHWVLIIVVHRTKLLLYLDSLHGYDEAIISLVFQFLSSRSMMAFKRPVMISEWTIRAPTDIPRQPNGWDCGVHVLLWSYIVCSGQPLPYYKELNMSEIRNWMANLILKEQHFEQDNEHLGSTVIQRLKEVKRHAQALRVKRITISRDVPVNFASTLEFLSNITRSLFNTNFSVCHLGKQCTHPQRNRKMAFCEGDCQDWFHVACVNEGGKLPKHFLCESCRSK